LKHNFILDSDYKIVFIPKDENSSNIGRPIETVMLNMDTLKHLSIIIKTPEGKRNRIYHIKLEKMYNKLINNILNGNEKVGNMRFI
jgi:phage anti-repressor protein